METVKGRAIHGGIVIGRLMSKPDGDIGMPSSSLPTILMANEITPNEVLALSQTGISSFLLSHCSETAHTAILARTSGFPSLFDIALSPDWEGKVAILDGDDGKLIVSPDDATLACYRAKQKDAAKEAERLAAYRDRPAITRSGAAKAVFANINRLADLDAAIQNGAEGVFFKTEFLFLTANDYPSEEEQFRVYREVAKRLAGRLAVIRTVDIGADKKADYMKLRQEENPQLGNRGIRLSLSEPAIFERQLTAILRASAFGNVAIMLPMVTSFEEVVAARALLDRAKATLRARGEPFSDELPLGIMIETPSAVFMAKELAEVSDFFSIGTNDLTQYLLAADRQNPALAAIYNPYHPAVFRAIDALANEATAAGITLGISGELGGDERATERLCALGVTLFSVAPDKILSIKETICKLS